MCDISLENFDDVFLIQYLGDVVETVKISIADKVLIIIMLRYS